MAPKRRIKQPKPTPKPIVPKWLSSPKPPKRPKNMPDVLWLLKWVALFCVLGLRSYKPEKAAQPFDQFMVDSSVDKIALVITAHPDDEVMFFAPTILSLVDQGWQVNGLCLSNGNAAGLGSKREDELYKSYAKLGVPQSQVKVLNDPRFPDTMKETWDANEIAKEVESYLASQPASLIITFDERGITSHPNHQSIPYGLRRIFTSNHRIMHLKSPGIIDKFTGPLIVINHIFRNNLSPLFKYLGFTSNLSDKELVIVSSGGRWATSVMAMIEHQSQMEWFRWLYLLFSKLMWANELVIVR